MMMIAQLAEWLIVAIRLNFLWPAVSSFSVTDTLQWVYKRFYLYPLSLADRKQGYALLGIIK